MEKSKNNQKHLFGVILAGGSGMRLWPISRELYPKQLLKLIGSKTLIQQTFLRLKKIIPVKNIYVVTNENFTDDIYLQLRNLGVAKENIIKEPLSKNTAPATALAAKVIFDKNKSARLLICPADHLIKPDSEFVKVAQKAFKSAQENFLITFGIVASYPSQEYGYIKANYKKPHQDAFFVEKFIEKPNLEKAKKFVKEKYLFNSGIFVWKAEKILEETKKFLPAVYRAVMVYSRNFDKFLQLFGALKAVSLDKGILEKSAKVLVIPARFDWQDIGSWKSLHQLLPKDADRNVLNEHAISEDCFNCLIQGIKKRVVVGIGLKDLIVVDSEDAVLVSHQDHSHRIKNALERMRENNFSQYFKHPTIYRPWGYFTVIEEGKNFKVKKVVVEPKQKLSLQLHKKRSEHWVILQGKARIELNNKIFNLKSHESIDIPVGSKHRLENPSSKSLEIIEIQSGNYLKEDDIIRFEDKYGRK